LFAGLTDPTAVRLAADGRVVVAEKSGLIKVFESLADTQPDVVADLRTNVHNFWGPRTAGLALDPDFPNATVLYTYEAAMGWHGTARVHRECYVGPLPQPTGRDHRRLRRRRTPITNDRLWERGGRQ
jgi:hypothetical protein